MSKVRSTAGIALASVTLLAVASCGVPQSNTFVDALNNAQMTVVDISTSVSQAQNPKQISQAINRALPQLQEQTQAVEAAQADLSDDLKPQGQACVTAMNELTAQLESLSAAAADRNRKAVKQAAGALEKTADSFGTTCVDPYNAAIGQQ